MATAFKVVGADLKSALIPWAGGRIGYSVGGNFDAAGIAICGPTFAGTPLSDPENELRGIMVRRCRSPPCTSSPR